MVSGSRPLQDAVTRPTVIPSGLSGLLAHGALTRYVLISFRAWKEHSCARKVLPVSFMVILVEFVSVVLCKNMGCKFNRARVSTTQLNSIIDWN